MKETSLRENIPKNRQDIITNLCLNNKIAKMLYYDSKDALSLPSVPSPIKTLAMKKIIPLPFVKDVETFATTNINVFFDTIDAYGTQLKNIILNFVIVSCYDVWELDGGKLRAEEIMFEIMDLYDNKHFESIGKAIFKNKRDIAISNRVYGYQLRYELTDFR